MNLALKDTTNRTWPWQNEDYLRVGLAMFTTGVAYIVTLGGFIQGKPYACRWMRFS